MRIAPISFGKAVRVNGSKELAFDIARLVNEKKVSKSERVAQKQAQAIFDDVTGNAPARVVSYPSYYNQHENVFVVSGKEALQADKLYEKMVTRIIEAGNTPNNEKRNNQYQSILNRYNESLKSFLLDSKESFDVKATYNEKGTAIKSITKEYPSVYAVAGTQKQIIELSSILKKSQGKVGAFIATELYKDRRGEGSCTQAAKEGKEICFFVTGKETNDKISFMEYGWSSLNGISRHIEKFIELDDVKEQAKLLQEAMKNQE